MRPWNPVSLIFGVLLFAGTAGSGLAQMFPPQFRDIGIDQRLGAQVPLGLPFRDQNGTRVQLGDYFHGKPVLLLPVYYTCTTLCCETLRGLVEGISRITLRPGADFEIVAFSINPNETPADALKKVNESTLNYAGKQGTPGWHFLTGDAESIAALTNAIGFHYRYDPQLHIFVHAAGLMILTPGARLSRYLFGVTFQPRDLQAGLVASTQNSVGVATSPSRMICYPFTAGGARYNGAVLIALQLAAGAMLLALALALFFLWRADLRGCSKIAGLRSRL